MPPFLFLGEREISAGAFLHAMDETTRDDITDILIRFKDSPKTDQGGKFSRDALLSISRAAAYAICLAKCFTFIIPPGPNRSYIHVFLKHDDQMRGMAAKFLNYNHSTNSVLLVELYGTGDYSGTRWHVFRAKFASQLVLVMTISNADAMCAHSDRQEQRAV